MVEPPVIGGHLLTQQQAGALGISGVPFYVLDTRFGVSGAQPAATFTAVLDKAWEQRGTAPS